MLSHIDNVTRKFMLIVFCPKEITKINVFLIIAIFPDLCDSLIASDYFYPIKTLCKID